MRIVGLLLIVNVMTLGAGRLTGKIVDSEGELLIGVTGYCDCGHLTFKTDETGAFALDNLELGPFVLHLKKRGYSDTLVSGVLKHNMQVIHIVMSSGIVEEIVVTATRTEKVLSEIPIRTEVINREKIELLAPRTLSDAVEFSTGVRVESSCQNCNFSQIRMLGLDGGYSQVTVNGISTFSSLAMVYGIEQIPVRMIDRIEIVKGGGSAVYGSGSIAGVVNVITKEPLSEGGAFETRLGFMEGHTNISVSGIGEYVSKNNDFNLSVFGQSDEVNPVDLSSDGFSEVSMRKFDSIGLKMNQYFLGGDGRLSADWVYFSEDRRGGDQLDRPEHEALIAESIQSKRNSLGVQWRHSPSSRIDYTVHFSHAEMDRDSYYGSGQDPNAYGEATSPLTVFDSQINHYFNNHLLSWGLQYQHEKLEDLQPAYDRITNVSYDNTALFIQDDWDISNRAEIIYGLRIDKHSTLDKAVLVPRAALKMMGPKGLTMRASLASGFLAPQVFDEDLHITQVGGEGMIIENDPGLKEERSMNYVFSLEWTPKIGPGYLQIESSMFYTGIKDQFFISETDDLSTLTEKELTRINLGASRIYGLELNLGYQIPQYFTVQVGMVSQESVYSDPEPDFNTRSFFRTPNYYGTFSLLFEATSKWNVFIGSKFTGQMVVPHYAGYISESRLEQTPSFIEFDISTTYELKLGNQSMTLSSGIKNVSNSYQEDLDQGMNRDSAYVYGPRFPRSLFLSLKFDF